MQEQENFSETKQSQVAKKIFQKIVNTSVDSIPLVFANQSEHHNTQSLGLENYLEKTKDSSEKSRLNSEGRRYAQQLAIELAQEYGDTYSRREFLAILRDVYTYSVGRDDQENLAFKLLISSIRAHVVFKNRIPVTCFPGESKQYKQERVTDSQIDLARQLRGLVFRIQHRPGTQSTDQDTALTLIDLVKSKDHGLSSFVSKIDLLNALYWLDINTLGDTATITGIVYDAIAKDKNIKWCTFSSTDSNKITQLFTLFNEPETPTVNTLTETAQQPVVKEASLPTEPAPPLLERIATKVKNGVKFPRLATMMRGALITTSLAGMFGFAKDSHAQSPMGENLQPGLPTHTAEFHLDDVTDTSANPNEETATEDETNETPTGNSELGILSGIGMDNRDIQSWVEGNQERQVIAELAILLANYPNQEIDTFLKQVFSEESDLSQTEQIVLLAEVIYRQHIDELSSDRTQARTIIEAVITGQETVRINQTATTYSGLVDALNAAVKNEVARAEYNYLQEDIESLISPRAMELVVEMFPQLDEKALSQLISDSIMLGKPMHIDGTEYYLGGRGHYVNEVGPNYDCTGLSDRVLEYMYDLEIGSLERYTTSFWLSYTDFETNTATIEGLEYTVQEFDSIRDLLFDANDVLRTDVVFPPGTTILFSTPGVMNHMLVSVAREGGLPVFMESSRSLGGSNIYAGWGAVLDRLVNSLNDNIYSGEGRRVVIYTPVTPPTGFEASDSGHTVNYAENSEAGTLPATTETNTSATAPNSVDSSATAAIPPAANQYEEPTSLGVTGPLSTEPATNIQATEIEQNRPTLSLTDNLFEVPAIDSWAQQSVERTTLVHIVNTLLSVASSDQALFNSATANRTMTHAEFVSAAEQILRRNYDKFQNPDSIPADIVQQELHAIVDGQAQPFNFNFKTSYSGLVTRMGEALGPIPAETPVEVVASVPSSTETESQVITENAELVTTQTITAPEQPVAPLILEAPEDRNFLTWLTTEQGPFPNQELNGEQARFIKMYVENLGIILPGSDITSRYDEFQAANALWYLAFPTGSVSGQRSDLGQEIMNMRYGNLQSNLATEWQDFFDAQLNAADQTGATLKTLVATPTALDATQLSTLNDAFGTSRTQP